MGPSHGLRLPPERGPTTQPQPRAQGGGHDVETTHPQNIPGSNRKAQEGQEMALARAGGKSRREQALCAPSPRGERDLLANYGVAVMRMGGSGLLVTAGPCVGLRVGVGLPVLSSETSR